jgi:PST family polysaccharide transporter
MIERSAQADLKRTVVRGASVGSAGIFLKQALTLAVYIVLARLAAPEVFGTWAAASILAWFGGLFVESGMTAALIYRQDRLEEAANTAFLSSLASGLAVTLLTLALSPVVGLYFGSHEIAVIAAAVSGVHLLNAATVVPQTLLRRRFSYIRISVIEPILIIVFGATAMVTLSQGLGAWGLLIAYYTQDIAHVVLDWTFCGWRPQVRRASWAMWRELAGYARHVFAGEILRQFGDTFNTAMIGRFIGRADLAQYNFGSRLATQTGTPLTAASYMLFPALSRISADHKSFSNAVLKSFRLSCFIAFPLSLILIPLGEPLSVLLLGEPWRTAGVVAAGLAAVGGSSSLRAIAIEVFKSSGRPLHLPRIYALSALLPALAVVIGLPWGVSGIAIGVSIAYACVAAYAALFASRTAEIRRVDLARAVLPSAVASAGMAAVLFVLEHFAIHSDQHRSLVGFALLAAEVGLGGVIYVSLVSLIDSGTVSEFFRSARDAWRPASTPTVPAVTPELKSAIEGS